MSTATPGQHTIAAVATPPGHGGIGVVRISGPDVPRLARALLHACPPPRKACVHTFHDGQGAPVDRGLVLYFRRPHSFTGEHVLELHAHGGPAVLDVLLQRALSLGARMAAPGEFSQRAFLNGKLDLAQAEAVADLIAAGSHQAARAAARSLTGDFSRAVAEVAGELVALRVYVEAAIDFPDEEIDFLGDGEMVGRLEQIIARLSRLRADAGRGAALREGLRIAIVGAPNVGKSSLLNCLAGRDSAIVTDLPGTTRDVLREVIHIDGLALHLADTAGLRATSDPIEAEGVRRTRAEIAGCDQLLLLVDDRCPDSAQIGVDSGAPQIIIRNKCDLSGNPPGPASGGAIRLSARTGDGVCALVDRLKEVAGLGGAEPEFMARRRHLDALDRAAEWLDSGQRQLCQHAAGELLAEDLRAAHAALGTITGEFTNDDLLGEIFAGFCVGK